MRGLQERRNEEMKKKVEAALGMIRKYMHLQRKKEKTSGAKWARRKSLVKYGIKGAIVAVSTSESGGASVIKHLNLSQWIKRLAGAAWRHYYSWNLTPQGKKK
jgi:hypothetical protein